MFRRMSFAVLIAMMAVPAVASDAAAVYKSRCAMCHGADGSGNTTVGRSMKVRDLRLPEVQKQTDEQLAAIIADGKAKMPAFKATLSAAEITAQVALIRTMKK